MKFNIQAPRELTDLQKRRALHQQQIPPYFQALVHYNSYFPHPPEDKFYLVDAAYVNRPGFLGPYRNIRYHLQYFQHGHLPRTMEELFNYRHAQLRCTVERAFGQLKNKFRILKSIPNFGLHTSNRIIVACMALHNFIKDNGGDHGGDWTETSIQAGNREEGIEPDLPDLMETASNDADQGYMDRLRDMIAAGMVVTQIWHVADVVQTHAYQPGTPPARPYDAPTPGSGWASTAGVGLGEASENAPSPYVPSTPIGQPMTPDSAFYLPGTPGGQPMTPGAVGMDAMSPVLGVEGEGNWLLPDVLVNISREGDGDTNGVVKEVL